MKMALIVTLILSFTALSLPAQEAYEGTTLISVVTSNDSYMIDMDHNVIKTWHGAAGPATVAYLLDGGAVIRPCTDPTGHFSGGGLGGRIQKINTHDVVVWDYMFSTSQYQQHHDIEPMPNGNVLLIAWELKTQAEAIAAGRQSINGDMWPTMIAEIEPVGATGGNIVWEWHLWDHLIQDADPTKDNYGVVADHPELVDINYANVSSGSWDHANSIDYNPDFDQIVISCNKMHEFYIIDHSTTTEEAAGHTGGNSGKGGDILFRWGNPQVYRRGTSADQYYFGIHGANWIDAGMPGAGNILTFNNGNRDGTANDYSSVEEIVLPHDGHGNYFLAEGEAYGPLAPTWYYDDPVNFYAINRSGAFRLPNGNTLITETVDRNVFEVTPAGSKVWVYIAPGAIYAGLRYGTTTTGIEETPVRRSFVTNTWPNPFALLTTIEFEITSPGRVTLEIFDVSGRRVATLVDRILDAGPHQAIWHGDDLFGLRSSSGVYFYRLSGPGFVESRKIVLTK